MLIVELQRKLVKNEIFQTQKRYHKSEYRLNGF